MSSSGGASDATTVALFLGAGGVGKTTLAASAALASARDGHRTVVLTVDPARRLADTLGLGPTGNDPVRVEGRWPGELWAVQLDPAATLTSLLEQHGRPAQVERLAGNPTFQAITQAMPGVTEYMAAERLHQLSRDGRFDRVVVDTPPSRHGIDFLDSPQRLIGFVDNALYRTVLAPQRGVLRSVSSVAHLVAGRLARLVGMDLLDSAIRFFADLDGLDTGFRQRAADTTALLASSRCRYWLVTSARAEPMAQAAWIGSCLSQRQLSVDTLVANRLTPFGRSASASAGRGAGRAALARNLDQLRSMASREDDLLTELVERLGSPRVFRVEERAGPVRGADELAELAAQLVPDSADNGDARSDVDAGDLDQAVSRSRRRPERPQPLRSTR